MKYKILEHTYDDPWTYVQIIEYLPIKGKLLSFIGHGFARRMATDPPDPRVGFELALSRARTHARKKRDAIRARRK